MKIEIWSDFACPFCYIGKKRFETALNQFKHKDQVEVIYKAYQLNLKAPKYMTGSAYETFSISHHMTIEQVKKRFNMIAENAKTVGLNFNYDIIQMTNTNDAHQLLKWANDHGKADLMMERLMAAYFTEGKNISDLSELSKLSADVGLNPEEAIQIVRQGHYKEAVQFDQTEAREIGVQGVPFFVINRTYGVSGAQDSTYFLKTLEQIYQEEQIQVMATQNNSMCDDDHCIR
jgi:predicted DsbA family dithiol-disulfide isomerase